LIYV
jgi:hypothetical protein